MPVCKRNSRENRSLSVPEAMASSDEAALQWTFQVRLRVDKKVILWYPFYCNSDKYYSDLFIKWGIKEFT